MSPTPESVIVAGLVRKLREPPASWHGLSIGGDKAVQDRENAAWDLGDRKAYSAIPDLAFVLNDKDPLVRINAAHSLLFMADHATSVKEDLKEALNNSESFVRVYSANALWLMDADRSEVIPVLTNVCKGTNLLSAVRAAYLAVEIEQDPKDFVPCLMRGMTDPEASKRVISEMVDEEQYRAYLPILLEGMKSANSKVRSGSANLLGTAIYASPEVTDLLRKKATSDPAEIVRANAVQSLVNQGKGFRVGVLAGTPEGTGKETIDLLVLLLRSHDTWLVRQTAAQALGRAKISTPAVIAALSEALKDPDWPPREAAARSLGYMGMSARAAEPALMAIWTQHRKAVESKGKIKDDEKTVVDAVKSALERMGEPQSDEPGSPSPASNAERTAAKAKVAELVRKLAEGETEQERADAAAALSDMNAASAIPDLALALKDPKEQVRVNAAYSIAVMSDQAASVQANLRDALHDSSTRVQVYSADALWHLEDDASELIPVLTGLCVSPDLLAAIHAADMGIDIEKDPKDFIPCLMRGMADQVASAKVIETMRKEIAQYRDYLPILLEGMKSADPKVRAGSAETLGEAIYKSQEVTDILRKAAASDPSPDVRAKAAHSLAAGGTKG